MMSKPKLIFEKDYNGFEDCYDLQRDIIEAFDERFNDGAKNLSPEFKGTITVKITYKKIDENKDK